MRVDRNASVTAQDGAVLLVDHHHPAAPGARVVVWIRTPYGRKQIGSIAKRFAQRGAHVIVEAIPAPTAPVAASTAPPSTPPTGSPWRRG